VDYTKRAIPSQMPQYIRDRESPPWMDSEFGGLWRNLPEEDREQISNEEFVYFMTWWYEEVRPSDRQDRADANEWDVYRRGGKEMVFIPWDAHGLTGIDPVHLEFGARIKWTGRVKVVDGKEWYEINCGGRIGWVLRKYVIDYAPPPSLPEEIMDCEWAIGYVSSEEELRGKLGDEGIDIRDELTVAWDTFLDSVSTYRYGVSNDHLLEAFRVYLYGIEYEGETVFNPDDRILGLPDFVKPGRSVAQDIDLFGITGNEEYRDRDHRNLCGALAIFALLSAQIGITIQEFLTELATIDLGKRMGDDFLVSGDTLTVSEVELTLEHFFTVAEPAGYANNSIVWKNKDGYMPKPDQIAHLLEGGSSIIALVNLDTDINANTERKGSVEGLDGTSDAGHFISIIETLETRDGNRLYRIYDPYQNQEAWVSEDTLLDAWAPGGPGNPNYRAVVGEDQAKDSAHASDHPDPIQ